MSSMKGEKDLSHDDVVLIVRISQLPDRIYRVPVVLRSCLGNEYLKQWHFGGTMADDARSVDEDESVLRKLLKTYCVWCLVRSSLWMKLFRLLLFLSLAILALHRSK